MIHLKTPEGLYSDMFNPEDDCPQVEQDYASGLVYWVHFSPFVFLISAHSSSTFLSILFH